MGALHFAHAHHGRDESYLVSRVPVSRPLVWLARGWDDLLHHRGASLAYGLLVSVLAAVVVYLGRHPYFFVAAITGFMLVGPILTAGLCELSRRRDHGETADFGSSLATVSAHRSQLAGLASVLLGIAVLWFAVSTLMLYLSLGTIAPDVSATQWDSVLAQLSARQLTAYVLVGGALAAIVFALSVVSVPMIVDSAAEPGTAMRTSLRVTQRDLPAMIVWGALIVALVAIGFATWLIGMIVVFPLLGHATWYAYRDLVH